MKLGILNAISPEASVVNWGGTPVDTYIRFFESVNAPFTYAGYQVAQGQFPTSPLSATLISLPVAPKGFTIRMTGLLCFHNLYGTAIARA